MIKSGKKAVMMAIAGLDPSGGAGLAADVKAASALGVFCTPVLAAITVQDTRGVRAIRPIEPGLLRAQAEAVIKDIGPEWVKVGVLYSVENIRTVASLAEEHGLKLVVDPIISSSSGQPLLAPGGLEALRSELIPNAFAITPNAREASLLSGLEVKSPEDAEEAARALASLGPKVVIIKGGHLGGQEAVDILLFKGHIHVFKRPRLGWDAHGTGCAFSSALAACLALGMDVVKAVEEAGGLAWSAIRWSVQVGQGRPVAEPLATLLREAERYQVLEQVRKAVELLTSEPGLAPFVPEVGTQVAMAVSMPEGPEDVAAVEGRLVKVHGSIRPVGSVRFGASSHMARLVLTAMEHDSRARAAMNLRYDPRLLETLREMGLLVASFDRAREPPEVAEVEGATLPWGLREAIRACGGRLPDVVYDLGGLGKEPMIRLIGRDAEEVAKKALRAVRTLLSSRKHS